MISHKMTMEDVITRVIHDGEIEDLQALAIEYETTLAEVLYHMRGFIIHHVNQDADYQVEDSHLRSCSIEPPLRGWTLFPDDRL